MPARARTDPFGPTAAAERSGISETHARHRCVVYVKAHHQRRCGDAIPVRYMSGHAPVRSARIWSRTAITLPARAPTRTTTYIISPSSESGQRKAWSHLPPRNHRHTTSDSRGRQAHGSSCITPPSIVVLQNSHTALEATEGTMPIPSTKYRVIATMMITDPEYIRRLPLPIPCLDRGILPRDCHDWRVALSMPVARTTSPVKNCSAVKFIIRPHFHLKYTTANSHLSTRICERIFASLRRASNQVSPWGILWGVYPKKLSKIEERAVRHNVP